MTDKLLERRHGAVLTLAFNRSRVRNAVDAETMDTLRRAVEACGDETRVIVITGTGGAFCSGADLTAIGGDMSADAAVRVLTESYHPALKAIRAAPCPVIAVVDGSAAGIGCDIALACDMRLVSERAVFAELFVKVGLVPDGGGTWTLPRLIGLGRALELMYTGMPVDAAEALRIGMANRMVRSDHMEADVAAFTTLLAAQPAHALRRMRQAVYAAQDMAFDEALAQEARLQREIFARDDGFEGFRAFLEKRMPRWT